MSDELELSRSLETRPSKEESAAFLRKLSGIKEDAQAASKLLLPIAMRMAPSIAAGAVGGGVASGLQYVSSKPGKSGKSRTQEMTEKALRASQAAVDEETQTHGKPTFETASAHVRSKAMKEQADLSAQSPGKAALRAFPVGVAKGMGIYTGFKGLQKLFEGKKT